MNTKGERRRLNDIGDWRVNGNPGGRGSLCPVNETAPQMAKGSRVKLVTPSFKTWSERKDSNLRPSDPKSDALPGCATLRQAKHNSVYRRRVQQIGRR